MATFAERLKELRKEKQLTVEQLANNIGSAKSTISRYENGREPKGDIIRLLTNYFNVSIDYLMGISDNRNPSTDKEIKNLQGSLQTYEIILKTNLEAYNKENYKQRQIINHLSRKIQNKNKKYRQLQAKKMPPTMYGREVVIVPDSMADKIMVANKDFFEMGSDISNGKH